MNLIETIGYWEHRVKDDRVKCEQALKELKTAASNIELDGYTGQHIRQLADKIDLAVNALEKSTAVLAVLKEMNNESESE